MVYFLQSVVILNTLSKKIVTKVFEPSPKSTLLFVELCITYLAMGTTSFSHAGFVCKQALSKKNMHHLHLSSVNK